MKNVKKERLTQAVVIGERRLVVQGRGFFVPVDEHIIAACNTSFFMFHVIHCLWFENDDENNKDDEDESETDDGYSVHLDGFKAELMDWFKEKAAIPPPRPPP